MANYARKDIVKIREHLIELVKTITDKWTDFNESDLGMVFIELAAAVADLQHFYLDKQSNENFIETVKQRKNAKKLLNLIGYKFKRRVSAVCTGKITLTRELTENLYIPKYTQVSADFGNNSVVYYATRNDCVIPAGQLEVEVPFIQGIVTTLNLTVKELKTSSVYNLLSKNVAEDSVILKVGDEVWEEVEDAYLVINPGKIYSVHDSKTDDCYIQFGSGFRDVLPSDESTVVTITYLNSLGADGQIRAGSINKLHSDIMYQGSSIADDLIITNYDNSSGGSERESILNARVNSRALLKTTDAAITLPDYEALTNSFNGVCKSKAIDWTVDGTDIVIPYYIKVYVLPTDDDMCSPQQLTDIKDFLYTKKISSMTVEVVTAIIDEVDIDAVVYTNAHSTEYEVIRQSVVQALETYFDRYNRSFGELIRPNKLLNVIEDASDLIDFGDINLPNTSIKLGLGHFPMLGTVNITVEPVGGE